MRKLLTVAGWLALAVGLLAVPVAYGLDAAFGRDVVWMASVTTEAQREWFRQNPDAVGQPVEVYGEPYRWTADRQAEAIRTVFVRESDLIVAEGDPNLVMLPVTDPEGDGAPLQASSVHHISLLVAGGAGGFGLLVLLGLWFTRSKPARPDAAAAGAPPTTGSEPS